MGPGGHVSDLSLDSEMEKETETQRPARKGRERDTDGKRERSVDTP